MSIIVIQKQVVHYEAFGRGQPVLFLHGFHGSWRYWYPTMERVSQKYRTYSFDFWGFGGSQIKSTPETIEDYSTQVIQFLDALGLEKVLLVGHSMGGMVGIKTAINHPNRISRLITVGAPVTGTSINWALKLLDNRTLANMYGRTPWMRRALFRAFLGETADPLVHEVLDDSMKGSATTLRTAVGSMWRTDLRPVLETLKVPTLVVHGGRDQVVDPRQAYLFHGHMNSEIVMMLQSRHFPFLDEPHTFNQTLLRFLARDSPRPTVTPRPTVQAATT